MYKQSFNCRIIEIGTCGKKNVIEHTFRQIPTNSKPSPFWKSVNKKDVNL